MIMQQNCFEMRLVGNCLLAYVCPQLAKVGLMVCLTFDKAC